MGEGRGNGGRSAANERVEEHGLARGARHRDRRRDRGRFATLAGKARTPAAALAALLALAAPLLAAEAPAPTPAARTIAALEARLGELLRQGTGLVFRDRYEALLTDAALAAEEYAADPAAPDFYRIIARICEALGKHPEKDAAFAHYIDLLVARDKARAKDALRREAEALIARRELFAAIKILQLTLVKFPDGEPAAYALYRLGTCHLWMDHNDAAEEALADVVERWPNSPHAVDARLRLTRAYLSKHNYAGAIPLLERFVAEQPKSPDRPAALFFLAVARHFSRDYYRALIAYQRVAREAPKSPYTPLAKASIAKLRADVLRRFVK